MAAAFIGIVIAAAVVRQPYSPLHQFPFAHGGGGAQHLVEDGRVVGEEQHGLGQEVVAGQHRRQVAEPRLHRGVTAPAVVVVHHVIVDERGRVHHLREGGGTQRQFVDFAKELRTEQHEDGPQALALGFERIAHDVVHRLGVGLQRLCEEGFEPCHFSGDGGDDVG